jgi:hypothetical protein
MPTVLIISMHFPPSAASGSFRILGFCRHLPNFGWQPSVVACPAVPREPIDEQLQSLIPSQRQFHYVPYPSGPLSRLSASFLYRARPIAVDRHLPWNVAALQTCRRVIEENFPDAILTSGPPHSTHLLGLKLKTEFNLPLIADFRDPWVTRNSSRKSSLIAQSLEQAVFKNADKIIANAPNALEALQAAHPGQNHKMSAITNGFDLEEIAPTPEPGPAPFEILHTGELYAGRNPAPFLAALRAVEQSAPHLHWRATFLGRAIESDIDILQEARALHCVSPVTVEDQIPYLAAKERMRRAHILLLLDSPNRHIGVPAKLYEYIGANRPLLVLAEPNSDTAHVARTSGLPHRIASPTDPAAIQRAILELSTLIHSAAPYPDQRATSPYTRHAITRQLAHLLNDVQPAASNSHFRLSA